MKKILIIEDEAKIRSIYLKIFESLGVPEDHIYEADNAIEATGILITEKVHLVLLDIHLPTVDGTVMYEVIKEYAPQIDVIIASVTPEDEQRKMFPDAADYYDKSRGPYVLLDKLSCVI